jgi:ribosomal-protein-alanine N-acetyltransferase
LVDLKVLVASKALNTLSKVDRAVQELVRIESVSNQPSWNEKLFRDEWYLEHSFILAVLVQAELLGFLVFHNLIDFGHIVNLAVLPLYRKQGVASWLLAATGAILSEQGVRSVLLEVRESNQAAKQLYQKFRFRVIGSRPNYYQDNLEDALVMKSELPLSLFDLKQTAE